MDQGVAALLAALIVGVVSMTVAFITSRSHTQSERQRWLLTQRKDTYIAIFEKIRDAELLLQDARLGTTEDHIFSLPAYRDVNADIRKLHDEIQDVENRKYSNEISTRLRGELEIRLEQSEHILKRIITEQREKTERDYELNKLHVAADIKSLLFELTLLADKKADYEHLWRFYVDEDDGSDFSSQWLQDFQNEVENQARNDLH